MLGWKNKAAIIVAENQGSVCYFALILSVEHLPRQECVALLRSFAGLGPLAITAHPCLLARDVNNQTPRISRCKDFSGVKTVIFITSVAATAALAVVVSALLLL